MAKWKKYQSTIERIWDINAKLFLIIVLLEMLQRFTLLLVKKPLFPNWIEFLFVTMLVLSIFIAIYTLILQHKRLNVKNIEDVDRMSGTEFEKYLERLFKQKEWKVLRKGGSGDYGADFILVADNKKIAVQAKCWNKNVGYASIQQAFTSKAIYDCDEAWVVTNRYFSVQAETAAKKLGVVLWNRNFLSHEISYIKQSNTTPLLEIPIASSPPSTKSRTFHAKNYLVTSLKETTDSLRHGYECAEYVQYHASISGITFNNDDGESRARIASSCTFADILLAKVGSSRTEKVSISTKQGKSIGYLADKKFPIVNEVFRILKKQNTTFHFAQIFFLETDQYIPEDKKVLTPYCNVAVRLYRKIQSEDF